MSNKLLSTLCNPFFCNGLHPRPTSSEQVEELLAKHLKDSFIANTFGTLMSQDLEVANIVQSFIEDLKNRDILALCNQSALVSFRNKISLLFSQLLDFREGLLKLRGFFYGYMINLGTLSSIVPCLLSLSAEELRIVMDLNSSPRIIFKMFRNGRSKPLGLIEIFNLQDKGWREAEREQFIKGFTAEITELITAGFKDSLITKWFEYVFRNVAASRLLQSSFLVKCEHDVRLQTMESTGINIDTIFAQFETAMQVWCQAEIDNIFPLKAGLAGMKLAGDAAAVAKNYLSAVEYYEAVTFLSIGDRNSILQASTNSAALRLRLYHGQPLQIQAAIFDCTMALEIDPNNVKALFRRGLGLALVKKWNESIVDFERALELDPNSPAKKELEIARRQVMRRIDLFNQFYQKKLLPRYKILDVNFAPPASGFYDSEQQKELALISRICSSWKEAQGRLFSSIKISTSEQLSNLVTSISGKLKTTKGSDSDNQGVGGIILTIQIQILLGQGTAADSHLIVSLFNSTPNLTTLKFNNPSFTQFNSKDISPLRSPSMLKNLTKLEIETKSGDWHREVFDSILLAASNLRILSIKAEKEYVGPIWNSSVYPDLQVLELNRIDPQLKKVWSIVDFRNLQVLKLDVSKTGGRIQKLPIAAGPCIQVLARTLKELVLKGIHLHPSHYSFFRSLDRLSVEEFCSPHTAQPVTETKETFEANFMSIITSMTLGGLSSGPALAGEMLFKNSGGIETFELPPFITRLNIEKYRGPSLPLSHLTKLKSISINRISGSYDLATIPITVQSLSISKITLDNLKISLKNLVVGRIPFERLELGSWYDDKEIVNRCQELGINLVGGNVDYS